MTGYSVLGSHGEITKLCTFILPWKDY